MNDLENTPVQIGAVIMLMIRSEESMRRSERPGPVVIMEFLLKLYEQYWRLHWDILQGEIPYRIYTCIDAEQNEENVYERFKYVMATALNIHRINLAALAMAFPKEFDQAKAEYDRDPKRQSSTQRILSKQLEGGKVLIVCGDDMKVKDEILRKPFIEGLDLR